MNISSDDFQKLVAFVRDNYGINLEAKKNLIEARLSFDMTQRGFSGFPSYVAYVLANPNSDECQHMMNRLSTNYSFFFRESDALTNLTSNVLPEFCAKARRHIRIWSAACSSGQEAYSIAMAIQRSIEALGHQIDYKIVGSDINTEVLEQAANGIYSIGELENIPKPYRRFTQPYDNQHFVIKDDIKRLTSWKKQNLLEIRRPCEQYDIVFCRNVLIYFKPETRKELVKTLFDSVKIGGYLYTGATETIDLERKYFKFIAPSIYKKEVSEWTQKK